MYMYTGVCICTQVNMYINIYAGKQGICMQVYDMVCVHR